MAQASTNAQQRFQRAVQMLSLAISHVLRGNPYDARTNLRAAWDDLKHSATGRIEHMATAAFVSAVDGNVSYAVHVLGLTLNELQHRQHELHPEVSQWVQERCILVMEYLPYGARINEMVARAYEQCHARNHAEALHILTQANNELKQNGHLIPPRIKERTQLAWTNVLESMLADDTTSALAFVRDFSARCDEQLIAA